MQAGPFVHLGGIAACPYLAMYGDSPGIPRSNLAEQILDTADLIYSIGWQEAALLGPHIQCTDYEATLAQEGILWALGQKRQQQIAQQQTLKR